MCIFLGFFPDAFSAAVCVMSSFEGAVLPPLGIGVLSVCGGRKGVGWAVTLLALSVDEPTQCANKIHNYRTLQYRGYSSLMQTLLETNISQPLATVHTVGPHYRLCTLATVYTMGPHYRLCILVYSAHSGTTL